METPLDYSWAERGDLSEIQAFLMENYGEDSVQALPGRCRWLYFENPLGLHVSTCRTGGELVAVCGHLAQRVRWEDQSTQAGFGIDFMVAKKWRRRGIGRKFLEMRLARFPLSLSLGQSREMSGLYQTLNAVDLGPLYLGIHRRRPSISPNPKTTVRNNLAWLKGLSGVHSTYWWTGKSGDLALSATLVSDPEWFAWRYCSQPYGDYSCTQLDTEQTGSLAVHRTALDHEAIVDVYCGKEERPIVLAAVARRSRKAETRILFAGDKLKEDCARAGFWIRPHPARVIAMTADPQLQKQLKPGILDMMSGASDADLLRIPSRA